MGIAARNTTTGEYTPLGGPLAGQTFASQEEANLQQAAAGAYIQLYPQSQTYAKDIILAKKGTFPSQAVGGGTNPVDELFNWFNAPFRRDQQFRYSPSMEGSTVSGGQQANFQQVMADDTGVWQGTGGKNSPERQNIIQSVGNKLQSLVIGMYNSNYISESDANYANQILSDGNNVERFMENFSGQPSLAQQNSLAGPIDAYTRNQLITLYSQELYGDIYSGNMPVADIPAQTGASGRTYTGEAALRMLEAEAFEPVGAQ